MKKKSKIIIIVSTVILIVGISIPTSLTINKNNQIKKQQALKIADAKTLKKIAIANKAKANKLIADKKMAAKKIATEKLRLAKIEATRIANKKIKDEKLRLTRIANAGLTLYSAKRIALRLRDEGSFTPLYDTAQWLSGHWFYVFSSNDPEGKDDGSDWRLCIDKTTKKAYMYYSNNKLVDFGSDYTPPEVPSSVTVTDATTPDYLSDGRDREPIVSSNNTTTVTYTMDNNKFLKYNYENGTTFKLKIGQKIKMNGTVTNSDFRTMLDSADDIFTSPITNKDNSDITMTKVGTGDIEVVPNYSDWDRAYTIHVIVTD